MQQFCEIIYLAFSHLPTSIYPIQGPVFPWVWRRLLRYQAELLLKYDKIDPLHPNIKMHILNLTNRFQVVHISEFTSVTHSAAPRVPLFVLTTFWRHLWSVTEQTHGNLESICFI